MVAVGLGQRDAAAQDARERYKEASGKAAEGRYDEALAAIEAGLQADPGHLDLRRLRGEVLLQKRDFEGALEAFERFLEANPRGANRRKARKIIRDLEAVKTTFVEVIVEPGPATIYVDSKLLGVFCKTEPSCKKGMLPGSYELIIESPGFEPTSADISVELGKTATVKKRLAEKPSKLTVSVTPAGAALTVDGQSATAGTPIEVSAGEHVIAASLPGFAAVTRKVTAGRGKPLAVELSLAEKIPVKVSPAGAALTLDGEPVELRDGFLQLSPGGDHTLVARADGYLEATVALSASRTPGQAIELELKKKDAPSRKPAAPATEFIEVTSKRKIGAAFLLGAATVTLGVGAIFGVNAASSWEDSKEFCNENVVCFSQEGVDLVNEAKSDARWADIAFATSAGRAVTAAVLWVTAPSADDYRREAAARRGRQVSIGSGPGDLGVSLGGSFCCGLQSCLPSPSAPAAAR